MDTGTPCQFSLDTDFWNGCHRRALLFPNRQSMGKTNQTCLYYWPHCHVMVEDTGLSCASGEATLLKRLGKNTYPYILYFTLFFFLPLKQSLDAFWKLGLLSRTQLNSPELVQGTLLQAGWSQWSHCGWPLESSRDTSKEMHWNGGGQWERICILNMTLPWMNNKGFVRLATKN